MTCEREKRDECVEVCVYAHVLPWCASDSDGQFGAGERVEEWGTVIALGLGCDKACHPCTRGHMPPNSHCPFYALHVPEVYLPVFQLVLGHNTFL
jgi:hypothetical protein